MAIKLKLRVPGSGNGGSPANNGSENQPSSLPKLKIKPPSLDKSVSNKSSPSAISKKTKAGTKEKHKKLKISLSNKKPTIERSVSIPQPAPQPSRVVPRVRIKPTRIPGDGYDSEAPDLEDDPLIEQGIVIRFLKDLNLDFVHNAVDSGDLTGINVKWVTREKAVVNVNGTLYSARLIDLPTVTELYKTIDKKNIFKTFDICQILLVLHTVNLESLNKERDFEVPEEFLFKHPLYKISKNSELKEHKFVLKDGLTSPFEEVHRRFRARKVNHRVVEDIEMRVNELLKMDEDAEESHFELVDLKKAQPRYGNISGTPSSVPTPTPISRNDVSEYSQEPEEEHDQVADVDMDEDEDIELHLEEELQKALDENGDLQSDLMEDDQGDLNGVEGGEGEEVEAEEEEEEEEDEEDDEDEEDEEDDDEDEDSKADKQHVKLLEEEIEDLEKVVEYHRKNLATATSKMMRMKFQNTYTSLKSSLDQKKRNLARLVEEQEQLQKKLDPTNIPKDAQRAVEGSDAEGDGDDDEEEEEEENNNDQDEEDDDNLDDIDDLF
ncbi:TAFII55 protein conserved region-domain-containing protein [Scheffersomyces xylosifermentans]|uniref:TAFII55 protein conserved region-domain-containing protein n=1 Tax=Scheffersomyces xylosifermentans TaxID=1304137 RepID=UPI00315CCF43